MTSLTDAKKRLYVINNGFNYHLIVLSTSPLLFLFIFFILIFQINYCCGDFPFFWFSEYRSFFQQRQWSAMDGLCKPVCTRDWSSKRPGGYSLYRPIRGQLRGASARKGEPFSGKMIYKRVRGWTSGRSLKIYWAPGYVKDASSVKSCLH